MTTVLGPVPEHLRARACEVLGHMPPERVGLPGCPVPDADLVEQLCDRVEALTHELLLAHSREDASREPR